MQRPELEAELLAWMLAWQDGDPQAQDADGSRFERLALSIFAWQFEHIPPFAAFCTAQGRVPGAVQRAADIPLVPVSAFQMAELSTPAAVARPAAVFDTSGTTGGRPGRVHLGSTSLYDASAHAAFARFVVPDLLSQDRRMRCLSLVPSAAARPRSSLGHMVRQLMARWDDGRGVHDLLSEQGLDTAALAAALDQAVADAQPLLIFATTLALDLWLAQLQPAQRWSLPAGSRLMDTGGPKGRVLDLDRPAQHAALVARLGLDPRLVVGELGMTELSSQRYETTLRAAVCGDCQGSRVYLGPPWLRARVLRPQDHAPCEVGQTGMIGHIDLANLDTCAFVLTADLGCEVEVPGAGLGLQLAGRLPGSAFRGCGLDAESLILG